MTRPTNEPRIRAVLHALARILERAASLHAAGCHPRVAINRAAAAERASLALAQVARAAWVLALPPDGSGTTAPASLWATRESMAERGSASGRLRCAGWQAVSAEFLWMADDDELGHDWFSAADDAAALAVARPLCLGYFDAAHVAAMTFAIFRADDDGLELPIGEIELSASNVAPLQ